jgi:cyclic di-GMP phosphodiesterase
MTKKAHILIVDDNLNSLDAMQEIVQSAGYDTTLAQHGKEALDLLSTVNPTLIVTDLRMPRVSGIDLLRAVRMTHPDTGVVLLTGHGDIETAVEALKLGADDFLLKPVNIDALLIAIERALERRQLLAERRRPRGLEAPGAPGVATTMDVVQQDWHESFTAILRALGAILDRRAGAPEARTERLVRYVTLLAGEYGLSAAAIDALTRGVRLRDIGQIEVPDAILSRTREPVAEECSVLAEHPRTGAAIARGVPLLRDAVPVIGQHHERWDGTGYPDGLKGDEISIGARILAVAEALETAASLPDARAEIDSRAATWFDPTVVAALRRLSDETIEAVRRTPAVGPAR